MRIPKITKPTKKAVIHVAVCLILLIIFGAFLWWLNSTTQVTPLLNTQGVTYEKARVESVLQDNIQDDGTRAGSQVVQLTILTGEHRGETFEATSASSYLYGADCVPGLEVTACLSESNGTISVSVYNYYRSPALYLLAALFLALLWLIGGKKGLRSALGLIFTFCCILWLFLPLLCRGCSPFLAAVLVVALTTAVTMYLVGGATKKTVSSVLGTLGGVTAAGLIAWIFGELSHISGYNVTEIETLISISDVSSLQVGGLLFAGILIASLGAVMDVAMSVSSSIEEVHRRNPALSAKELMRSGLHVGRDMMGTMSNTLVLAFCGSSINTLVTVYAYAMPYNQVMSMYDIGIEILHGLAGTMGVILTVPLVSLIMPLLLCGWKQRKSRV